MITNECDNYNYDVKKKSPIELGLSFDAMLNSSVSNSNSTQPIKVPTKRHWLYVVC